MKVLHIFLGLWMLVCLSCSGFLDEVDQDKFIPSTTDHYASVLLEEFNKEPGIMPDVAFMTDEIQELESSFASSSYRIPGSGISNGLLKTSRSAIIPLGADFTGILPL